jgi:hypothetical protein
MQWGFADNNQPFVYRELLAFEIAILAHYLLPAILLTPERTSDRNPFRPLDDEVFPRLA